MNADKPFDAQDRAVGKLGPMCSRDLLEHRGQCAADRKTFCRDVKGEVRAFLLIFIEEKHIHHVQ